MAEENPDTLSEDFQRAFRLARIIDAFFISDEPDCCLSSVTDLVSLVSRMPVSQAFDLMARTKTIASECAVSIVFEKDLCRATADDATPAERIRGQKILAALTTESAIAVSDSLRALIPEDPAARQEISRKIYAAPAQVQPQRRSKGSSLGW